MNLRAVCCFLLSFTLFCCNESGKQQDSLHIPTDSIKGGNVEVPKQEHIDIEYSDSERERFLDSIGSLPSHPLVKQTTFATDSIFKNQLSMNKVISGSDFEKLKEVMNSSGEWNPDIDLETAKAIFGEKAIDTAQLSDGKLPLVVYSFDKHKSDWNEFAICPGTTASGEYGWTCKLYFFRKNRIVACHTIEHHYGLEINHFKDAEGRTVIYYSENFGTGSGIWQWNYYFYKYDGDRLIPVLNELKDGNLQSGWGSRMFRLETTIVKTNPLTMKMTYYHQLYKNGVPGPKLYQGKAIVHYKWDEASKTYQADYDHSTITRAQVVSYYIESGDLLFINSHSGILKSRMTDKILRGIIMDYLNEAMNACYP
ncbi:MAG: hypothetical protein U0X76_08175 [Bacteroidia bacterium]